MEMKQEGGKGRRGERQKDLCAYGAPAGASTHTHMHTHWDGEHSLMRMNNKSETESPWSSRGPSGPRD